MRLNIEYEVFGDPRLTALARHISKLAPPTPDIVRQAAVGMLAALWHGSQSRGLTTGSRAQIDLWCGLSGATDLLVACQYLTQKDDCDSYYIHGNAAQIEQVAAFIKQRSDAGRAGGMKRSQNASDRQAELKQTQAELKQTQANPSQLQLQLQSQLQRSGSYRTQFSSEILDKSNISSETCVLTPTCNFQPDFLDEIGTEMHSGPRSDLDPAAADAPPVCEDFGDFDFEIFGTEDGEGTGELNEVVPCIDLSSIEQIPGVTPKTSKKRPKSAKKPMPEVAAGISVEQAVETWNTHKHPKHAAVKAISATRRRKTQERIVLFPALDDWIAAVKSCASWPWGQGENGSGWLASFDWLLQENGLKAFEGQLSGQSVRKDKHGNIDSRDNCQRMSSEELAAAIKRRTITQSGDINVDIKR